MTEPTPWTRPNGSTPGASTIIEQPGPEAFENEAAFRAEVGWRLRKLRTWNDDLSQDELARAAGITRNFISAVERGAQGLDAWRLRRIAAALGVPLGVLLCEEPMPLTRTRNQIRNRP